MKILRVDMSNLETKFEDLPADWKLIGGRGLSAGILNNEVPPDTDPLGREAKLVVAAGPLAGTMASACGRISVGAKSPLTLGIKEANAGGPAAQKLDKIGIRAIVVEKAPSAGQFYLLHITKDGASVEKADQYKGMKNYALVEDLKKRYGSKVTVISIGTAGERKWTGATVTLTDKDGHPARNAARGGLGAVMGSKGLKAIIVDDSGTSPVPIDNKAAFKEATKKWAAALKEDPQIQRFGKYGTPLGINRLLPIGSSPSKNYSGELIEGFEKIGGDVIEKTNRERGGRMDGCMSGCLVGCSVIYHDAEGKHLTSSLEYETIALLGTNLGIVDPDVVALMDRICDDIGIDTIELGSAMGVAASAGKMEMGNSDSALALLGEVEKGTEFGAVLANGVVSTCKHLGVTRIPAFKGQAIPAHDPRVCKTGGVTYASSPMGADHTAGLSYEGTESNEGHVERSYNTQIFAAMRDTIGYCMLATLDPKLLISFLKDLINARYGLDIKEEDLTQIGKETLKMELKFNEGTEFGRAHDPDPEFVRNEPVGPNESVFGVDASEISAIWEKLYV